MYCETKCVNDSDDLTDSIPPTSQKKLKIPKLLLKVHKVKLFTYCNLCKTKAQKSNKHATQSYEQTIRSSQQTTQVNKPKNEYTQLPLKAGNANPPSNINIKSMPIFSIKKIQNLVNTLQGFYSNASQTYTQKRQEMAL